MSLSTEEKMLIEQRVSNDAKSPVIAYVLWFFLGGLGGHRFYLGRVGSAVIMLALFVVGILTLGLFIGVVPLGIVGIWILVDAFLIPGMVQSSKDEMRRQLAQNGAV
ncbi:hypothetical protein DDE20_14950 [Pararhodobacter oceanensis]|uniref:TM2 domain-containing protein n=2 Tax=Pararhodobacter oceanensis TaxID=2172121 RepID=A0A2T8HRM3_9RHOB|nr:hypothetical protein DDE20_14950 [Pararhodobacter oceanensis]